MIVNPQTFNYKVTIGTLLVAFSILAAYSYTSYSSNKSSEDFLNQEKKLLENQISEVISSYDQLGTVNASLKSELDNTKQEIALTKDSLAKLKADISLIYKYRDELLALKKQQSNLIKREDSFSNINSDLIKQNESIFNLLEKQNAVISSLEKDNEALNLTIKKAELVSAYSFDAAAYVLKNSGEIIEIEKASKAKNIRVAFVLAENKLAPQQEKDLYIQIIGPDNNVVADKGAIMFGESSLIYSSKVNVFYDNNSLEVCANVETTEELKSGRYYISVFDNTRRLGGTEIELQ